MHLVSSMVTGKSISFSFCGHKSSCVQVNDQTVSHSLNVG